MRKSAILPRMDTANRDRVQIEPAPHERQSGALSLVFGDLPTAQRAAHVAGLLDQSRDGTLPLGGLFDACRNGRQVAALWAHLQPGKTATLWPVRLVDGEGDDGRNTVYWQLMELGLLDAIQPDMLHMGFWPFQALARDIADSGYATRIAPHNFNAAALGLRGVIQFAAVTPGFVIAEDSTLRFDVYRDNGYRFENGAYAVPDSPGLGVDIDQELYARKYALSETLIAG